MAKPFTPLRALVFLLLCALGMLAVYGAFELMMHVRGHESIQSGAPPSV